MNIYCIKRKNKTNTLNIERNENIKNRNIIKGICEICSSKKSQFEKIDIIQNELQNEMNFLRKIKYHLL